MSDNLHNRDPLFSLGATVATPAALAALAKAGQTAQQFLRRHVTGDWGLCGAEDARLNDLAVQDGDRIFSVYQTRCGDRLYVITEADRSSTCLLLPDEY